MSTKNWDFSKFHITQVLRHMNINFKKLRNLKCIHCCLINSHNGHPILVVSYVDICCEVHYESLARKVVRIIESVFIKIHISRFSGYIDMCWNPYLKVHHLRMTQHLWNIRILLEYSYKRSSHNLWLQMLILKKRKSLS